MFFSMYSKSGLCFHMVLLFKFISCPIQMRKHSLETTIAMSWVGKHIPTLTRPFEKVLTASYSVRFHPHSLPHRAEVDTCRQVFESRAASGWGRIGWTMLDLWRGWNLQSPRAKLPMHGSGSSISRLNFSVDLDSHFLHSYPEEI